MSASQQDGSYPRPQLCRPDWVSLDGAWGFAFDDEDAGWREGWFLRAADTAFTRQITVPCPPESPASGVGDRGPHAVLWYRREVTADELAAAGHRAGGSRAAGSRASGPAGHLLLHFGAVDYRADVWVDGCHVASHEGGQTPFTADITAALDPAAAAHEIVVRAADDPHDAGQPRGKQTWHAGPGKVWYERTSGIWQPVWIEAVPAAYICGLGWLADPDTGVRAVLEVAGRVPPAGDPSAGLQASVSLELGGRLLGRAAAQLTGRRLELPVPVAALGNSVDRDELLWSPARPVLVDATVRLAGGGAPADEVTSYLGIRAVGTGGGRFLLNGRPVFLRAVLNQGYRPATHLASQGTGELRREVELAKSMGFNAMRIHQKAEDPRMLYWADRLGLLVWAEIGAAYEFSPTAVERLTAEWTARVRRDASHPSVAAWVPVNESWGLPGLAHDTAQQQFAAGIASLTRALDPTRPVLSNDGWEHVDSDILGVHDYAGDPDALSRRYGNPDTVYASLRRPGRAAGGHVIALTAAQAERFRDGTAPLVISEFGGLSLGSEPGTFAYTRVSSDTELAARLRELFAALRTAGAVAGFCYTQLLDTAQETNGLADELGTPKLPAETIRAIVTGEKDRAAGRPR